ncbi:hypothetical protein LIER_42634 [Lithospermum erythrorhizon]|uniref:Uncharacterized protein n=1 Tax=Lithospermum erythrorhizon TaxID=34254 RepID=A0AAV3NT89_LITER
MIRDDLGVPYASRFNMWRTPQWRKCWQLERGFTLLGIKACDGWKLSVIQNSWLIQSNEAGVVQWKLSTLRSSLGPQRRVGVKIAFNASSLAFSSPFH